MIKINGRKAIMSPNERKIGFENDNAVESRCFLISDPSLVGFSFKLDTDSGNIIDLEKKISEDGKSAVLTWNITSGMLSDGNIVAQLRAYNENTEQIWHSELMFFIVQGSLNAVSGVTDREISEFEEIEQRVTALKEAAKAYSEAAQASAQEVITDISSLSGAVSSMSDALSEHSESTSNPHGVTKAQVGLSNADNTSDADKPISTAVQAALDMLAPGIHIHEDAGYIMETQTIGTNSSAECYREDDPDGMAIVYYYLFTSASEESPKYVDLVIGENSMFNITINGKGFSKNYGELFEYHGFISSRIYIIAEVDSLSFNTLKMSVGWTNGFMPEKYAKEIALTREEIGDIGLALDTIAETQQQLIV